MQYALIACADFLFIYFFFLLFIYLYSICNLSNALDRHSRTLECIIFCYVTAMTRTNRCTRLFHFFRSFRIDFAHDWNISLLLILIIIWKFEREEGKGATRGCSTVLYWRLRVNYKSQFDNTSFSLVTRTD